jgi:hypothetical protein
VGVDGYQHLADKPEEIASFSAGQAAVSRTVAPAIIAAYDFSKFVRIVDVGGGNGAFAAAGHRERSPALPSVPG